MTDARTVVFFPEGAYGPTNNCVGIGQVLRARGHRVVFVVEESFAGTLEAKGFEERLMRLGPPPAEPEVPGQFWIDFIRDTAPVFRKPTIEQLGEFIAPTFQALIDGAKYVDSRLLEIFDEVGPDVIVEDNVVVVPGARRVGAAVGPHRVVQPGRDQGPGHRAVLLGLSGGGPARLAGASSRRSAARTATCGPTSTRSAATTASRACRTARSAPTSRPNPRGSTSTATRPRPTTLASAPLGPTWHRVDSSVRAADTTWELPDHLQERDGALIYLSLGSLGSADVGLMQRLVDLLATTEHRVIVSKGPLADQITLHDNQTGEGFLPQPAILPQVDLVITHGGNNTVTEAFHHGKPMIVLPLFWDQVDNAQRVDETGFGRRLATYDFRDEELSDAIDELLDDRALARRLSEMSSRIKSGPARCAPRTSSKGASGQRGGSMGRDDTLRLLESIATASTRTTSTILEAFADDAVFDAPRARTMGRRFVGKDEVRGVRGSVRRHPGRPLPRRRAFRDGDRAPPNGR